MTSSSPEAGAQVRTVPFAQRELRTGDWTRLGGSAADSVNALAVDSSGYAYVTGETNSQNFPTTADVFQPEIKGTIDVFVTKVNVTGANLMWSTFLGGDSDVGFE